MHTYTTDMAMLQLISSFAMAALSTVALLLLCIAQEVNSTPVHDLARTIAAKAVNPVWASDGEYSRDV